MDATDFTQMPPRILGGSTFNQLPQSHSPIINQVQQPRPPIIGVGVLRCPNTPEAMQLANQLIQQVHSGMGFVFPNTRDEHGDYEWDFRIEAGEPMQVRIEHSDLPGGRVGVRMGEP